MIERIKYIANIVIVAMMFATVAIIRDGRVLGVDVATIIKSDSSDDIQEPVEVLLDDGLRVINSSSLAKDVVGFGGRTAVKIYIKDDVIERVVAEPNSETPSFFKEVVDSGLLSIWQGMNLSDAVVKKVDGVSGATYTSMAIIENIKRAVEYGANVESSDNDILSGINLKDIVGLLVVLSGVIISFINFKSKMLITFQLLMNVIVLGFWSGSFLSLSTLTSWIGNGVNISISLVTFAMLIVAIIVPLLGKKGSYCHLHCPMGSAQELVGRIALTKIRIKPSVSKFLNNLRYYILAALLFVMWLGVGFDIMNYEIFSAFIISSASNVVLVMAALFLVLSIFIQRPYCRFICPTGALITITQKTK